MKAAYRLTMVRNGQKVVAALPPAAVRSKTTSSLSPVLITVRASSSDPNVLPIVNILLGSNGLSRTLSVRPLKAGNTTVTLTVSDGLAQDAQLFSLTVTNAQRFKVRPSKISTLADGFTIAWESTPGELYRVLANPDLTQTNWVDVSGELMAVAPTTSWTDISAGSRAACLIWLSPWNRRCQTPSRNQGLEDLRHR